MLNWQASVVDFHHFVPLKYNFLSIRELFLQFADGYGILHDSEGSCEKFTLSFFIFRVKSYAFFGRPRKVHEEQECNQFIYSSSYINYIIKFKFFNNNYVSKVCNVCHLHHVCSEVHLCRRVFSSDLFFLHGQLVDSVIVTHPTVSRVNVELVRHFLAES